MLVQSIEAAQDVDAVADPESKRPNRYEEQDERSIDFSSVKTLKESAPEVWKAIQFGISQSMVIQGSRDEERRKRRAREQSWHQ